MKKLIVCVGLILVVAGTFAYGCSLMGPEKMPQRSEQSR